MRYDIETYLENQKERIKYYGPFLSKKKKDSKMCIWSRFKNKHLYI